MQAKTRNWVRCGLVTAVVLVVTATAGQGFANTRTHADPVGDVQVSGGANPPTIDPMNTTADIVSVTITNARRITGKVTIRELPQREWSYYSLIKTPSGSYAARVGPAGHVSVSTWPGQVNVKCPNRSVVINHVTNTVALRVPRSCLDKPAWVRFAIIFSSWHRHSYLLWSDQPFGKGGVVDASGKVVHTFSKRLRF